MKRSLFIFGFLSDSDVEWLASVSERQSYAVGTPMLRQGKTAEKLLILIDGTASVVANGKQVATVSSGDVIGEVSLFDSRPPSATVTPLEPTLALVISFETLRARLRVDPEFASRLYYSLGTLLSQRLRETLGSTIEDADEIDPEVMEQVSVAAQRLELLFARTASKEILSA
jgi:CRP/FNR family cyclic AMP-dependent transcriptional regulator